MSSDDLDIVVRRSRHEALEFTGVCLERVVLLNHDGGVTRRQFTVYKDNTDWYVAESIDKPDTLDVRFWGKGVLTIKLYMSFLAPNSWPTTFTVRYRRVCQCYVA